MNELIIEAKNVKHVYNGGIEALRGVNLSLRKGCMTAVLGGNGAGKSTLLLVFNGIIRPASGEVLFKGKPVDYSRTGLRELKSKVGIVFQNSDNQLFSGTVYQDICFGPLNMGISEEEVARRADEAMSRLDISDLRDRPVHSLSFGQKKRVAIAGVLAMQPVVIIFDEPTAGLDPMSASNLMKLLKEMQKELGLTLVIATHDVDLVPVYCDYTYLIEKGQVCIEGTPEEVFGKTGIIRHSGLRLPRIAHLMEILQRRDGLDIGEDNPAMTISQARQILRRMSKK